MPSAKRQIAMHSEPVLEKSFADALRAGLTKTGQKEIPCSYLYDELGSALFEAITLLPEYGVTRAERRLLQHHAETLAVMLPFTRSVLELGSGSASKTRKILEAFAARGRVTYFPIDVSAYALDSARRELEDIPSLRVHPLNKSYLDALAFARSIHHDGFPHLVLFLGGTIGNFHRADAAHFLRSIRQQLSPGDAFLLGADLDKPASVLIAAYDDATGVTAAFNRNLLAHINRKLNADFDPKSFSHEARFDERERRIEMHLRSTRTQTVTIPSIGVTVEIEEGETLWTESSYRYGIEELRALALKTGFREAVTWVDSEWPFASTLWIAKA